MTLTARNSVILSGVSAAFLFFIVCIIVTIYTAAHDITLKALSIAGSEYWWMMYGSITESMHNWVIPIIFSTTLFAAGAGYFLYRFFRKTVSYEVFFFTMFILSLSLDAVRIFQLLIRVMNIAPYYGVLMSRVSYLGMLFGTFCLFASSFYAMNIQYQKTGVILGLSLFIAFTLAISLPFDITSLLQNLLYKVNFEKGLFILVLGISLFTILNYIWAGVIKGMKDYMVVLAAVVLVMTGRSLLFFMGKPLLVITGGVCLITGTVIFGKKLHSMYLWV